MLIRVPIAAAILYGVVVALAFVLATAVVALALVIVGAVAVVVIYELTRRRSYPARDRRDKKVT